MDQVLFEEVLEGGGEEGAILNDGGTTTEGEDWNGGYTSGDFYWEINSLFLSQDYESVFFFLSFFASPYFRESALEPF